MRPFSDQFVASMRHPHLVVSRCDLYFPGNPEPVTVPIEAGSFTCDRTAQIRRTASVQIPWSLDAGSDLGLDLRELPFGGYAVLRRGLRYADGSLELIPLGHLRVESVSWSTLADSASLELADRMAQVRDEPFLTPYVPLGGASITRTGTTTNGSAVVTGLSATGDLLVGMTVTGSGVPPGTTILSIDSATQITLTKPVVLTALKTVRAVWHSYTLTQIGDTSNISPGMTVTDGVGIYEIPIFAAGTIVTSVDSPSQVSISKWCMDTTGSVNNEMCNATFTAAGGAVALTFSGGARIATAAVEIVQQVFGSTIAYRKLSDPNIITSDAYFSDSRSDTLAELATAGASDAYFDADGNFVYDVAPGQTAPVWNVDAGETGVMVDASEALSRTGVYNGVLVSGQLTADTPPVSALVTDNDPASPTYWGGPFGKVARIESSTAVQTTAQATDAATAYLRSQLGLARSLTLTEAPNPALEASDVITVTFPDGRVETHLIDTVSLDLGTGPQTLATRSVYVPATLEALMPMPLQRRGVYHGADAWKQLEGATRA